jgi:hypothetical protein
MVAGWIALCGIINIRGWKCVFCTEMFGSAAYLIGSLQL